MKKNKFTNKKKKKKVLNIKKLWLKENANNVSMEEKQAVSHFKYRDFPVSSAVVQVGGRGWGWGAREWGLEEDGEVGRGSAGVRGQGGLHQGAGCPSLWGAALDLLCLQDYPFKDLHCSLRDHREKKRDHHVCLDCIFVMHYCTL